MDSGRLSKKVEVRGAENPFAGTFCCSQPYLPDFQGHRDSDRLAKLRCAS